MKLVNQVAYMPRRVRGVYYGWWLVAINGFISWVASVPIVYALGVWAVALESHFGWNRTQLGLAFTFSRIEGGLMGPVEGYLTDRMGTRRMVLFGLLVLGAGFLLFGQVRNLWMFYLAFLVMNLGHGMCGWVPMMTLLNHWFARRRATAIGWSNVVGRLGALLLVPALAWAINPDQDRLGWQLTALVLGVFTLTVALPISKVIRNRPEDYNLRPDGDSPDSAPATTGPREPLTTSRSATTTVATDFTPTQALRTPAFWLISFGHGFSAMVVTTIFAHLGLLMKDEGFDLQATGWVIAVYTMVSMVFQVVGGYVGDRIPKRAALFVFTCVQSGGVALLTFPSSLTMFYLFAVVFGIGFGGRNPLTVAIRGEYFGRTYFGRILGLSTAPMNVLLLIGAPFAGLVRDTQGTYTIAFVTLAALNFLSGFLFLMAKKPVLTSSQMSQVVEREA